MHNRSVLDSSPFIVFFLCNVVGTLILSYSKRGEEKVKKIDSEYVFFNFKEVGG